MRTIINKHEWLTSSEVCDALGINPSGLKRMVDAKLIQKRKAQFSTIRRYLASDVAQLIDPQPQPKESSNAPSS